MVQALDRDATATQERRDNGSSKIVNVSQGFEPFRYRQADARQLLTPTEARERIARFNPRSHLGNLIRDILHLVPDPDIQLELIEAVSSSMVVVGTAALKVLRSQQVGDLHCIHKMFHDSPTAAHCVTCGERYKVEDLGIVSDRVITDVGVKNLADVWNGAGSAWTNFKYVALGTGTTAESVSGAGAAMVTELTTEYNPDSTRATGTTSTPSNNVLQVVGTNTLDSGTPAVTETGWLNQAGTGGGLMWDRFKYSAINLNGANGDGIQSTLKATFTSGG